MIELWDLQTILDALRTAAWAFGYIAFFVVIIAALMWPTKDRC